MGIISIFCIFILSYIPDSTEHKDNSLFSIITTKIIRVYQIVISPRQGEVCNFTPGCSHYAQESIKKHGIIGIIMTFDRLERCNYFAWQYKDKYYKVKQLQNKQYKLYDPVK